METNSDLSNQTILTVVFSAFSKNLDFKDISQRINQLLKFHQPKIKNLGGFDETDSLNAVDIKFLRHFNHHEKETIISTISNIAESLTHNGFDFCWNHDQASRIKKLLISDMDMTMIHHETLDELASKFGYQDQVAEITRQGMEGEIDFNTSVKLRVKMFMGQNLNHLIDGFCEQITLHSGAQTLIHTMKKFGCYSILVSGGFSPIGDTIKERIGFDTVYCNQFELDEQDQLTGELAGEIINSEKKKQILTDYRSQLKLENKNIMALGDGANDLPMMKEVDLKGLSVGYYAKKVVQDNISVQIKHTDLHSLLYFQGIPKSDWVINF